jgi:hypothetical protein
MLYFGVLLIYGIVFLYIRTLLRVSEVVLVYIGSFELKYAC